MGKGPLGPCRSRNESTERTNYFPTESLVQPCPATHGTAPDWRPHRDAPSGLKRREPPFGGSGRKGASPSCAVGLHRGNSLPLKRASRMLSSSTSRDSRSERTRKSQATFKHGPDGGCVVSTPRGLNRFAADSRLPPTCVLKARQVQARERSLQSSIPQPGTASPRCTKERYPAKNQTPALSVDS